MQKCEQCGQIKEDPSFITKKGLPSKRCFECRDKAVKAQYAHKIAKAGSLSNYHRARRLGISPEEVKRLDQVSHCAICEVEFQLGGRRWGKTAIDHDHKTGEIRGVLCHNCNTGIGKLQDSVELLEKAIIYLQGGRRNAL